MCRNTFIIPNPSRLLWSLSPTITPLVWLQLLCNALCFFTVAVGKIPLVYFFVHHIQRFGSSELLKVTTPYTSYMPYPFGVFGFTIFEINHIYNIKEILYNIDTYYYQIRNIWLSRVGALGGFFFIHFYDFNITYSN